MTPLRVSVKTRDIYILYITLAHILCSFVLELKYQWVGIQKEICSFQYQWVGTSLPLYYRKAYLMIEDITKYIEQHQRDYITEEFAFSSYNAPNTMYQISNVTDELLLLCTPNSIVMWHMLMLRLKRNHEPVKVVTVHPMFEEFKDRMSRNTYFKCLKQLVDQQLLIPTTKRGEYVVNIVYANKLYNPKLDINL